MGMGHLFPWPEDDWHEPMYEEYRSFTLGLGKDLASYEQLEQTRGMLWPVVDGEETRYRYAAGHDPYVKKARGVHFYKAKGYGEKAAFWLRPWHPPAEEPDEEYPFWLCTGRVLEHWHTGSMTRRVKQLHQAVTEGYVEMNRADAQQLGVGSGHMVRVVSRRGELELPVQVDGRGKPPRGSVFIPFFDEARLAERPHPRRDGQHHQGTGLQEVRGPGREGLRGGGMRASIVTVRAAAWLTALVALVAAGCSDPGKVPVPDREGAVKSTASVRAERRAYDGAPPTVPHAGLRRRVRRLPRQARSVGPGRGIRARLAARRYVDGRCDRALPPVPRLSDHRRPVRGFRVRGTGAGSGGR